MRLSNRVLFARWAAPAARRFPLSDHATAPAGGRYARHVSTDAETLNDGRTRCALSRRRRRLRREPARRFASLHHYYAIILGINCAYDNRDAVGID